MRSITHAGARVNVQLAEYENGRTAIRLLTQDGGAYATASVNLIDEPIQEGEVAVKNWSENEGILEALIEGGIVFPPHRQIRSSFVDVSVCRFTPKALRPELQFGYSRAVPKTATTCWGARLIFPDDLLPDRQSFANLETPQGQKLQQWLNGGALKEALTRAKRFAVNGTIDPGAHGEYVLHLDKVGTVVGDAQSSHGYLYVAAWLNEENDPT